MNDTRAEFEEIDEIVKSGLGRAPEAVIEKIKKADINTLIRCAGSVDAAAIVVAAGRVDKGMRRLAVAGVVLAIVQAVIAFLLLPNFVQLWAN